VLDSEFGEMFAAQTGFVGYALHDL